MGEKKITNAWKLNNKKQFLSIAGVKNEYAYDLLGMGDIKLSKNDFFKLKPKTCSKILEELGYKWIKI